jgi:hypothetical protein
MRQKEINFLDYLEIWLFFVLWAIGCLLTAAAIVGVVYVLFVKMPWIALFITILFLIAVLGSSIQYFWENKPHLFLKPKNLFKRMFGSKFS